MSKEFRAEKILALVGGIVCTTIFIIICILISKEASDITRREASYKKANNFKLNLPKRYNEVPNSLSSHNFKCYKKYQFNGDTIMCSYTGE